MYVKVLSLQDRQNSIHQAYLFFKTLGQVGEGYRRIGQVGCLMVANVAKQVTSVFNLVIAMQWVLLYTLGDKSLGWRVAL